MFRSAVSCEGAGRHTAQSPIVSNRCRRRKPSARSLSALIPSFERSLRARNRSSKTTRGYLDAAERLARFLAGQGMPTAVTSIAREHVEAFIEDQLTRWSASTAATRYRQLQQLFRWLGEEGEVRPPRWPA